MDEAGCPGKPLLTVVLKHWPLLVSSALEDSTIPLLLGSKRAVDVIRKFKSVEKEDM